MKTLRFAFLVMVLSLPVIGMAQNTVPELGTIRGTVTRTSNGEPLSGVTVTLQGGNADPQAIQSLLNGAAAQGIVVTPAPGASTMDIVQAVSNAGQALGRPQLTVANIQTQLASLSAGRTAPTATSDRDGRFTFANVTPGPYTVRVQKDGFFGKPEGGNYPSTGAIHVNVAAKETKDASLSLIPGGLIGGRVFGADGQLLSNAIVNALRVVYQLGHAVLEGGISRIADDRGEFRLFWVPPGDYYLTAEPPRAVPTPGVVTAPAGQGIKTFYPGVTAVTEAKVVRIKGGEETLGMDIGIRPISLFKVSGQVSSQIPPPASQAGAPAVNAAVLVLLSPDGNAPDDTKQVGTVPLLPSNGQFEISLLPGVYDLFARVPDASSQAAGGAPQAWGRARLDVRDTDINNVLITIPPSTEVKGTVTATGGRIPAAIRIQLMPDEASAAKIPAYQQVSRRTVTVNAEGAFSLSAVPEGRFRVSGVAGLPQDMYLADVQQGAQSVFDSGFTVNTRSTNPLEVVLASGAGTVNGVVVDGPAKVVPGATVVLVPEARRRSNRALYFQTSSDASGRFTLRGVAPGDYKIFAWESIPAFAHVNAAFMAKHEDRGKPVHVGQSGTTSAELTIIPAVSK